MPPSPSWLPRLEDELARPGTTSDSVADDHGQEVDDSVRKLSQVIREAQSRRDLGKGNNVHAVIEKILRGDYDDADEALHQLNAAISSDRKRTRERDGRVTQLEKPDLVPEDEGFPHAILSGVNKRELAVQFLKLLQSQGARFTLLIQHWHYEQTLQEMGEAHGFSIGWVRNHLKEERRDCKAFLREVVREPARFGLNAFLAFFLEELMDRGSKPAP